MFYQLILNLPERNRFLDSSSSRSSSTVAVVIFCEFVNQSCSSSSSSSSGGRSILCAFCELNLTRNIHRYYI